MVPTRVMTELLGLEPLAGIERCSPAESECCRPVVSECCSPVETVTPCPAAGPDEVLSMTAVPHATDTTANPHTASFQWFTRCSLPNEDD